MINNCNLGRSRSKSQTQNHLSTRILHFKLQVEPFRNILLMNYFYF